MMNHDKMYRTLSAEYSYLASKKSGFLSVTSPRLFIELCVVFNYNFSIILLDR